MVYCFAPGCNTDSSKDGTKAKSLGKKSLSFFKAPRDPALFELWKKSIPRADRELSKGDSLCELHFPSDDLEQYFITKLKDGTISKIKRDRIKLKEGAIPCIFPNLPACYSKIRPVKRKLPTRHNVEVDKSVKKEKEPLEDVTQGCVSENKECALNMFTYKSLLDQLEAVKLPNLWWGSEPTPEYLIFVKWTCQYMPEKRVVIKPDLSVKVFLKESDFPVPNNRICCADDVSILLQEIHNLNLCVGLPEDVFRSREKCLLFLPKREEAGENFSRLCLECRKKQRQLAQSNRRLKCPKQQIIAEIIYR